MRFRSLTLFALAAGLVALSAPDATAGPLQRLRERIAQRRAVPACPCPNCPCAQPQQFAPAAQPACPSCPGGVCPLPMMPKAVGATPAPAPQVVGGPVRDWLDFHGLRARLRAELDRRASLAADHPDRITAEQAAKGKQLVGQLGDGHLLELLIKYGPDIVALIKMILGLAAVL